MNPRPPVRTALAAAACALLLAGCSGDDSASTAGGDTAPASRDTAGLSATGGGAGSGSGGGGGEQALSPEDAVPGAGDTTLARVSVASSAVVRTGDLFVVVEDVRAAAGTAVAVTREAGGEVASERADGGDGLAAAELVLRVPPERFDDLVDRVAALGEERNRSTSSTPVGDELIDLESRLATQRASVERVRALLAEATDLGQVVQIEAELTRRTADLESLQARLAALQDSVELSTLTVRLQAEDGSTAGAGELPGFLDGLRGGWELLVSTATVVAAATGALVPFLPLLALAGWVALRLRRRRGPVGPPQPAPPPVPAA